MAKVLIVDDNAMLRAAYASFLEQLNHEVATAANVDEALVYTQTNTPDVILLDMLLPKRNGLEFLQEYDVVQAHPTVKVVAFSNFDERQIEDEAVHLGVKRYLKKSDVTPDKLEDILDSVLNP
jgi:two-component system NarL family response regulator